MLSRYMYSLYAVWPILLPVTLLEGISGYRGRRTKRGGGEVCVGEEGMYFVGQRCRDGQTERVGVFLNGCISGVSRQFLMMKAPRTRVCNS
jgi:hypothetical protein